MTAFRSAARSGVAFGIACIFLVLIGFTGTIAHLVGLILRDGSAVSVLGFPPNAFNMLLFLALIGIWAGASGAKKAAVEANAWRRVIPAAAFSGIVAGLHVGGLALLLGTLSAAKVQMSVYFAQLLPAAIKLFLAGLSPESALLFYLGLFLASGILGGLLRLALFRKSATKSLWGSVRSLFLAAKSSKVVALYKQNAWTRLVFYLLLAAAVFFITRGLGDYWNYTLGTIGIYVLLGLGLNIVVGLAGLLDLGYVAFFAIGGYTVALLTAPSHHILWSFWAAIPIGVTLAAFAGIVLGVPVLRLRGDYLAIVTLGFGQIIAVMLRSDELTAMTGGPKGVTAVGGPSIFGHPFSTAADYVYLILLSVGLVVLVTVRLRRSRVGRAWEAMREDESVARAMGINTLKYKLLAFAIGAAFAGLSGVIFASRNQFTGPEDYNLMVSFNVLASVIVGGMGSLSGVVAGAFALKGLPEVLRDLENYRVLAFGALLIMMMLIRPEGLIPSSRRKMELRRSEADGGSGSDPDPGAAPPPSTDGGIEPEGRNG